MDDPKKIIEDATYSAMKRIENERQARFAPTYKLLWGVVIAGAVFLIAFFCWAMLNIPPAGHS